MATLLDLKKLQFSLVIIRPRAAFFEWLKPVVSKQGFTIDKVYFPQEDAVWIIPAIGTFNDTGSFNSYLNDLKAVITREEMGKFGPALEDLPNRFTTEFCDTLFEFEVRNGAQIGP